MSDHSRGQVRPEAEGGGNDLRREDKFKRFLGQVLIFMTLISFLFVGLIINILQVFLQISLKLNKRNRNWCRILKKIQGHLVYILFAPPIFLLYFWSKIDVSVYLDDLKLIEDSKKPLMALIIPNHSYELDYMICFILADQLGNLGSYKSLSKDELKFIPIIGWSLWMADIIFVKRQWALDRFIIDRKLNELFNYEQFVIGLFAEGTRYTEEKYQLARDFADSKQLEPFKYHLMPKSRGFNHIVRYYLKQLRLDGDQEREKLFRIFNLQIIMPKGLKFVDFLNGTQLKADVYCEEVDLPQELREEILNGQESEENCPKLTKFLHDIYRRKDQLVDLYRANGNRFPVDSVGGGKMPRRSYMKPFLIWLIGFLGTHTLIAYLALTKFSNSLTFWTILISLISACWLMLVRIRNESEPKPIERRASPTGSGAGPKLDPAEGLQAPC